MITWKTMKRIIKKYEHKEVIRLYRTPSVKARNKLIGRGYIVESSFIPGIWNISKREY